MGGVFVIYLEDRGIIDLLLEEVIEEGQEVIEEGQEEVVE